MGNFIIVTMIFIAMSIFAWESTKMVDEKKRDKE